MENILKQGYLKKAKSSQDFTDSSTKNLANSFLQKFEPNRWYVFGVRHGQPYLEYFDKEESVFTQTPINKFSLATCNGISYTLGRGNRNFTFCIFLGDRTLELMAPSREQMVDWCNKIERNLRSLGILDRHGKADHMYSAFPVKNKPRPPSELEATGGASLLADTDFSLDSGPSTPTNEGDDDDPYHTMEDKDDPFSSCNSHLDVLIPAGQGETTLNHSPTEEDGSESKPNHFEEEEEIFGTVSESFKRRLIEKPFDEKRLVPESETDTSEDADFPSTSFWLRNRKSDDLENKVDSSDTSALISSGRKESRPDSIKSKGLPPLPSLHESAPPPVPARTITSQQSLDKEPSSGKMFHSVIEVKLPKKPAPETRKSFTPPLPRREIPEGTLIRFDDKCEEEGAYEVLVEKNEKKQVSQNAVSDKMDPSHEYITSWKVAETRNVQERSSIELPSRLHSEGDKTETSLKSKLSNLRVQLPPTADCAKKESDLYEDVCGGSERQQSPEVLEGQNLYSDFPKKVDKSTKYQYTSVNKQFVPNKAHTDLKQTTEEPSETPVLPPRLRTDEGRSQRVKASSSSPTKLSSPSDQTPPPTPPVDTIPKNRIMPNDIIAPPSIDTIPKQRPPNADIFRTSNSGRASDDPEPIAPPRRRKTFAAGKSWSCDLGSDDVHHLKENGLHKTVISSGKESPPLPPRSINVDSKGPKDDPPLPPRSVATKKSQDDLPLPLPRRAHVDQGNPLARSQGDADLRVRKDLSNIRPRSVNLSVRQQITPVSGGLTVMALKQSQVDILKAERDTTGGIAFAIPKQHFMGGLALVECYDAVWIAGWDLKKYPRLYDKFHIGDKLVSVNKVNIDGTSFLQKLLKNTQTDMLDIVIRRLPHAQVFFIQRQAEGESLGIKREGGTAEIVYVDPSGLASRCGLTNKSSSVEGDSLSNWCLTEINSRPLNLFFKDNEIEHRLMAVGKDISIVVQPADLIREIKKQLKKARGYKEYLVQ